MKFIHTHPLVALVVGLTSLIAAGFSTFFMILAVGVSDGAGHVTSQIMLAGSVLAGLGAVLIIGLSARVLLSES